MFYGIFDTARIVKCPRKHCFKPLCRGALPETFRAGPVLGPPVKKRKHFRTLLPNLHTSPLPSLCTNTEDYVIAVLHMPDALLRDFSNVFSEEYSGTPPKHGVTHSSVILAPSHIEGLMSAAGLTKKS